MRKNGLTLIELVVVTTLFAALAFVLLPGLGRTREGGHHRTTCQSNLKQWGLVFKMYSNESKGQRFPALQLELEGDGSTKFHIAAAPNVNSIYPEYLTDPSILQCPSDPDRKPEEKGMHKDCDGVVQDDWQIANRCPGAPQDLGVSTADASYVYFGWVFNRLDDERGVQSDTVSSVTGFQNLVSVFPNVDLKPTEVVPLQPAYGLVQLVSNIVGSGNPMTVDGVAGIVDSDIKGQKLEGHAGDVGNTIYRLREGVAQFLVTDTNNPAALVILESELFVMCDQPGLRGNMDLFNHIPGGCNVLYLDGHVSFNRYNDVMSAPGPVNQPVTNLISIF